MAAKAEVEYDPNKTFPAHIADSISELGFPTTIMDNEAKANEIEVKVN